MRDIEVRDEFKRVTFCRTEPSGNIFSIVAKAFLILNYEHRYGAKKEMWRRVQECKTYDCALAVIAEYVELNEEVA